MLTGNPRRRRAPPLSVAGGSSSGRRGLPPNPSPSPSGRRRTPAPLSRLKPRKHVKILARSASEPILWTARLLPEADGGEPRGRGAGGGGGCLDGGSSGSGQEMFLQRPHTCYDIFSPPRSDPLPTSPCNFCEEAKVVVSVTVEGSPGPVRAMVRLGDSVDEAIEAVVDRYGREGRSPRLDWDAAAGFELHHSHFSLQSLNKCDKIGEVGGRSFYLRKNSCRGNSFNLGTDGRDKTAGGEVQLQNSSTPSVAPLHFFLSFIAQRFHKIGRRTRKVWRVVGCIPCS